MHIYIYVIILNIIYICIYEFDVKTNVFFSICILTYTCIATVVYVHDLFRYIYICI